MLFSSPHVSVSSRLIKSLFSDLPPKKQTRHRWSTTNWPDYFICSVFFAVELDGERAEKESIHSRIWGLQRNIKLIQSERDVLEDKMKDAIATFAGVQNSLDKVNCFDAENI